MTGRKDCTCPRARHEHGTWRAYRSDHCHCRPCRDAWADYTRHYRTRRHLNGGELWVPSAGTALRLQALSAIGWSAPALADKLGVKAYIVQAWRIGSTPTVHVHTRARITALYDALWDQPQPSVRVLNEAKRRGWQPPMMLDDDTLDSPDAAPAVVPGSPRELQPCGTSAAYQRHRRKGEPVDAACQEAHRIASAERKIAAAERKRAA